MHTISIFDSGDNYHIGVDDISYFNGLLYRQYNYGEFALNFYELNINKFLKILYNIPFEFKNTPMESIEQYIIQCQSTLSDDFDPIIVSFILNEIESELLDFLKTDTEHEISIKEIFSCYSVLKDSILKFIEHDLSALNHFVLSLQSISTKFSVSEKGTLQQILYLKDIYSLICFDLLCIQTHNITIKKCDNCGLLFITNNRTDEIYCDRLFKNNRTCKQIGYEEKGKRDPFIKLYTTARKTQHARIRYNNHIPNYKEKYYEPWKVEAEKARDYYKQRNDYPGFEKWIYENKNKFSPN